MTRVGPRGARLASALAATALMALAAHAAEAADWKSMKPSDYSAKTTISVEGRERTYYRFTADEPLRFSIDGPTRVKILTRVRIPDGVDAAAYDVSILRDGVHSDTVHKEAYPKESAFYAASDGFRPGVIRRLYLDVPTGRHGYELRTAGRAVVDARLFESAGSRPSRVSIAPSSYDSVETLLSRDKELTYYVATKERPVVFDVVGPTTVKVNTRLLYDATMLGGQTYVVGVSEGADSVEGSGADDTGEDGPAGVGGRGPERLYRVETEPSQTIVCRDRRDIVPGALRHFMLEVPAGARTYTVRLVDSVAGGVAVKFYIPRGDLANEP